ncbi:hypothetical protein HYH03_017621 [Edaphochlamys debaryana]|uniref:Uncharacterized protein n=1 Tax=Edaphochlamys debaryana TaxID=47281 RepID=A0A835XNW5_9CHLO|nr:hypothetical protein HYH03_017621 [Edaphochlamys debaryana]|eukprot:KAG2483514.1 hypothetical protein HYH03_017621 [Edaphochlamys debaryana]
MTQGGPPGYPKVPGADVESPPRDASRPPDQSPGYPLYPGGTPASPPPGAAYPAGPGGYPTVPPAGAPGGEGYHGAGPGGAPGAPGQQQPPAWGVPVLGERVNFIHQHPAWGGDEPTRDNRFACCAWLTFILGFFFPMFWLVSVLLPCCLPGRQVRVAGLASCVASITYSIIAIILGPTLSRVRRASTASCVASIAYAIVAIILGPTLSRTSRNHP